MAGLTQNNPKTRTGEASPLSKESLFEPLLALLAYVQDCDYRGFDPFDGLKSSLFRNSPFYQNAWCRLAWLQFFKRSPLNLRRALGVPAGFNPKGGALFLMGHLNLYRHTGHEIFRQEAHKLYRRLLSCRIEANGGSAWGYNFDWQARAFFVPEGTPNLVATVYAGRAMLAFAQAENHPEALATARQAGRFLLDEMIQFETDRHLCFHYIPGQHAQVHNANLLGAAYLAELLPRLPEEEQPAIREKILKAVRFSVADMRPDGAWPYGTRPFHRWVDNFHTAFNIECLLRIGQAIGPEACEEALERASRYYLDALFTGEGLPKYYNHRLYPLDVHVLAQAMVLLGLLQHHSPSADLARIMAIERTLLGLTQAFQDTQGYFYYQKTRRHWNRIPYMRWGQAWMFYALSSRLEPHGAYRASMVEGT